MSKCPICGKNKPNKEQLLQHVESEHINEIPKDISIAQYIYSLNHNGRMNGLCRACGRETPWNEKAGKPKQLCGRPECKAKMNKIAEANLIRIRGVRKFTQDINNQEKMLAGRRISGVYTWSDRKHKFTYTGSYEKFALEWLDSFMDIDPDGIEMPGPKIEYKLNGEIHYWITDMYLRDWNLVIEIKDGNATGDKNTHPGFAPNREREKAKDEYMRHQNQYNYLKLTNKNMMQLIKIMSEIRLNNIFNEEKKKANEDPIININEAISNNKDYKTKEFNFEKFIKNHLINKKSTDIEKSLRKYMFHQGSLPKLDYMLNNIVIYKCDKKLDMAREITKELLKEYYKTNPSLNESLEFRLMEPFHSKEITLYHGSDKKLSLIRPLTVNVGTKVSKPRSSSFWTSNINGAKLFAIESSVSKYCKDNNIPSFRHVFDLLNLKMFVDKSRKSEFISVLKKIPVYVYQKTMDTKYVGRGHNLPLHEYTLDIPVKPDIVHEIKYKDMEGNIEFVDLKIIEDILKKFGFGKYDMYTSSFIERLIYHSPNKTTQMRKDIKNKFYKAVNKSNAPIYHLSFNNMNNKTITPSIPNNYMTKNGYENSTTKRVCFSSSIEGSLISLSQNLKNKMLYVHIPYDEEIERYTPMVSEAPDVLLTNEVWVTKPVKLKCIGKIKINNAKPEPLSYTYGNNKQVELYSWNYEWIEKYTDMNESVLSENIIFNRDDIEYNIDDFKTGKSNVLLITGFSGSGKSTLGKQLSNKYNAEYIEIDLIDPLTNFVTKENIDSIKSGEPIMYEYLLKNKVLFNKILSKNISDDEITKLMEGYIKYVLNYANTHKNKKFIIEGIQIYDFQWIADLFSSYPVIIKGTSSLVSFIRKVKREQWELSSIIKHMPTNIKTIFNSNKKLKIFKKLMDNVDQYQTNNEFIELNEEAIYDSKHKYPIFITLMHTGTNMANLIKKFTHDEFSHCGISFNPSLRPIYSFGRKKLDLHSGTGYCVMNTNDKFFDAYKSVYTVYVMYVDKDEYNKMKTRLKWFNEHEDELKYDTFSLVFNYLKIPFDIPKKKWFCSRFVAEIINSGHKLDKSPSLYKPQDFVTLNNITAVNSGTDLRKYDRRITEKNLKLIQENKPVNESYDFSEYYQISPLSEITNENIDIICNNIDNSLETLSESIITNDNDTIIDNTKQEYHKEIGELLLKYPSMESYILDYVVESENKDTIKSKIFELRKQLTKSIWEINQTLLSKTIYINTDSMNKKSIIYTIDTDVCHDMLTKQRIPHVVINDNTVDDVTPLYRFIHDDDIKILVTSINIFKDISFNNVSFVLLFNADDELINLAKDKLFEQNNNCLIYNAHIEYNKLNVLSKLSDITKFINDYYNINESVMSVANLSPITTSAMTQENLAYDYKSTNLRDKLKQFVKELNENLEDSDFMFGNGEYSAITDRRMPQFIVGQNEDSDPNDPYSSQYSPRNTKPVMDYMDATNNFEYNENIDIELDPSYDGNDNLPDIANSIYKSNFES